MIASSFYEEAYIFKPFFSRPSNSERYLVVKGFKYDQSKDKKFLESQLSILEEILEKMNTDMFPMDIFADLNVSDNVKNQFRFANINIANTQQIMINKIVLYIKGNNYFGEKYHGYLDDQKKAINWWINTFYPDKNGYKESLKKNTKELERMVSYNMKEIENFSKTIIAST